VDVVVPWLPSMARGLQTTLWLAGVVVVISSLIGAVGGLAIVNGPRPVRWFLRGYVDIVRGIPILVLLFTVYFGSSAFGSGLDQSQAAIVALSVFAGAHMTEIVRGGIGSLPRATIEAAEVIGLTSVQRLWLVVAPLVLPRILPPWVNTAVEIVKATSLASLIGVIDLLYATNSAIGTAKHPIAFYFTAAAIYFVMGAGLSRAGATAERHYRYHEY
jgi:polar amino acid transport system permease protein